MWLSNEEKSILYMSLKMYFCFAVVMWLVGEAIIRWVV